MNIYNVLKCYNCGKIITLDGGETVMVSGADNLKKAAEMLMEHNIDYVKKKFCANCGGLLPCGCLNPRPQ